MPGPCLIARSSTGMTLAEVPLIGLSVYSFRVAPLLTIHDLNFLHLEQAVPRRGLTRRVTMPAAPGFAERARRHAARFSWAAAAAWARGPSRCFAG